MPEILLERHKKKSFLHPIVTGDEQWIHYDKSYVKPGQPAKSTAKPNIHGAKVMLCIWWDQKGVIFRHDNARPHDAIPVRNYLETVDGKFYPTRLIAQTLPLLTTICSGRCRTPSLEYGVHQNRVSKIGLIHSLPPSRRSSFGMEPTNCQKDRKKT